MRSPTRPSPALELPLPLFRMPVGPLPSGLSLPVPCGSHWTRGGVPQCPSAFCCLTQLPCGPVGGVCAKWQRARCAPLSRLQAGTGRTLRTRLAASRRRFPKALICLDAPITHLGARMSRCMAAARIAQRSIVAAAVRPMVAAPQLVRFASAKPAAPAVSARAFVRKRVVDGVPPPPDSPPPSLLVRVAWWQFAKRALIAGAVVGVVWYVAPSQDKWREWVSGKDGKETAAAAVLADAAPATPAAAGAASATVAAAPAAVVPSVAAAALPSVTRAPAAAVAAPAPVAAAQPVAAAASATTAAASSSQPAEAAASPAAAAPAPASGAPAPSGTGYWTSWYNWGWSWLGYPLPVEGKAAAAPAPSKQ